MRKSKGDTKPQGEMKVKVAGQLVAKGAILAFANGLGAAPARLVPIAVVVEAELERTRWYPKDGELCLSRLKPEETLVEDRSDSDVQIDRRTWV